MHSIPQASSVANVSTHTIRRLIEAKKLKAVRIGARWMIPTTALEAMLEQGTPWA
jgi:excisionase family DNA binding protein